MRPMYLSEKKRTEIMLGASAATDNSSKASFNIDYSNIRHNSTVAATTSDSSRTLAEFTTSNQSSNATISIDSDSWHAILFVYSGSRWYGIDERRPKDGFAPDPALRKFVH